MADILVLSDARWMLDEVEAVLDGATDTMREITTGEGVLPAARERKPDLAVMDMQVGSMGAMAVCRLLRLEESAGRLDHVPVLFLLDRRADVFLARRADADGWVVKPLDPIRLRKAIDDILDGRRYEDESYRPATVAGLVAAGPGHD